MSHFVVTGAIRDLSTNIIPNRLEINDFIKNEEMFSLYIQALDVMTKSSQDDVTSFFQIGGIHGLPYVSWSDAGGNDSAKISGYCTHGSVLFPTWHRPYVALFEQVIQQKAMEIAATYTVDSARWQKIATDLRQPYWDWAKNSVPPPEVISLAKVSIIRPNGLRTEVENPFVCYRFRFVEPTFPRPFISWSTTLRRPTSLDSDAKDNVNELIDILRADQSDLTSKTYNLLTRVHTWQAFSNHTPEDGGSASNSLEAVHDDIHVIVGGNGHMGDPAVAGFDPIFYLHHCQIDRLLAMWRALHPRVWVTESREEDGTYTIAPGAVVDETTPLAPFWNTQVSFWTSSDISEAIPSLLGYSYPEFENLDLSDRATVRTQIARAINDLYGTSGRRHYLSPEASLVNGISGVQRTTNEQPTVVASEPSQSPNYVQSFLKLIRGFIWSSASPTSPAPPAPPTPPASPASQLTIDSYHPPTLLDHTEPDTWVVIPAQLPTAPSFKYWEWAVRIRVRKYELGGSFSVLIFLGPVPEDPTQWRTSPSYVGAHHAFVNSTPQRCTNCRRQKNLVIEGFVHLDEAITVNSCLSDVEYRPSDVKPYLRDRLQWRVQRANGSSVHPEDVASLEVTVVATRLSHPPGEMFPVSEEAVFFDDITHRREDNSHAGL